VPVDIEALKPELQRCLEQHFSVKDPIDCITPLGTKVGLNYDRFVKVTVGEQPYGFKTYPEATNKQEDHRKYAEQDLMMAEIGALVSAPSCCAIRQVSDITAEPFAGWTVNIIKFLPEALPLNKLNQGAVHKLQTQGEAFLKQFGEWLSFTMAMGVQDRGAHQFVYDGEHLAMIDMDCCLTKPGHYAGNLQALAALTPLPPNKIRSYSDFLLDGIRSMNQKLTNEATAIRAVLNNAKFSDLAAAFDPAPDRNIETTALKDLEKLFI
jgi:hypothetical protein